MDYKLKDLVDASCRLDGVSPNEYYDYDVRQIVGWLRFKKEHGYFASDDPHSIPAYQGRSCLNSTERFRAALVDAILMDNGIEVKSPSPESESYRGATGQEISRACLRKAGKSDSGHVLDIVGRALTTSDLPYILEDVANKSVQEGFELHEETHEAWTDDMSIPDFKAINLVSASSLDDIETIKQHGEYHKGYLKDSKEQASVGTGGKIYPFTRETIINNELYRTIALFRGAGEKAKKYEADLVYALLTSNPAMNEDGHNLFDADNHDNIGTAGVPDMDTINEFNKLLGAKKGLNDELLNIRLKFIIAPRALEGISEAFFRTQQILTADNLKLDNPLYGPVIGRVYEPRLDVLSTKQWYGTGPRQNTIVRCYLNGIKKPYIEMKDGWYSDGIEMKVRFDVGVGLRDWRGFVTNPGRG